MACRRAARNASQHPSWPRAINSVEQGIAAPRSGVPGMCGRRGALQVATKRAASSYSHSRNSAAWGDSGPCVGRTSQQPRLTGISCGSGRVSRPAARSSPASASDAMAIPVLRLLPAASGARTRTMARDAGRSRARPPAEPSATSSSLRSPRGTVGHRAAAARAARCPPVPGSGCRRRRRGGGRRETLCAETATLRWRRESRHQRRGS